MLVSSNGKVRRTAEEWRQIMARFHRSGLSQGDFCRRERINFTSFQRWSRRLESTRESFVELQTPVESKGPSTEPFPWIAEIEFPSGCVLRLRG
jgi:hypothetical protein